MTDSTGTASYTYSPYGELTREEKGSILKTYTYDALGRRTSMSMQEGEEALTNQTYTYDSMGRLISTKALGEQVEYTYDANSNLLSTAKDGNVYSRTQYNAANLPVVTVFSDDTGIEDTTRYFYTPDGNLAMTMGTDTSSMYYYDGANRLVYENTWGDNLGYDDSYTYDSFGNRVNRSHRDYHNNTSVNTAYTYNNINQLVSSADSTGTMLYTYDTAGNMTTVSKDGAAVKQYTYDLFNRLATANVNGNSAQYTYNGDNLRQTKTVNGVTTHHVYDGQNIVADIGTDTNTYVYGANLIGMRTNGGTLQIYATTPRGDVAKLITPDGTYQEYEYDAYGNPTGDNTYRVNPFGYTGEYQDLCSGLIYLRNRYYDPSIGRFITEDPVKDGLNWYVYANNNPVNYIDPFGLDSYVFYAKGVMAGDGIHTFEDEANIWAEDLAEEYETKAHIIEVSSAKDFAEKWNKMGNNKKDIDGVVLVFHGSVDDGTNGNGEKGGVGYMYVNNKNDRIIAKNDIRKKKNNVEISSLDSKNIKKLIFSSCNSGNPDVYNVAYAFMKANKIENKVVAWDGGTIFNYETETLEAGGPRSNQHTWKKYVKKKLFLFPVRERIGKRVLKDEY